MKLFFYLSLIINSLTLWNCDNNSSVDTKQPITLNDTSFKTHAQRNFKLWLTDSIQSFRNWENTQEPGVKKEISLSSDSLSLNIVAQYSVSVNKKAKFKKDIEYALDLLKQYDELPDKNFEFSFKDEVFYYPSSTKRLRYDFVSELKDIKVLNGNSISNFDYIRGRISGKEVIRLNLDRRNDTVIIDFIWEGDSLIKHPNIK